MKCPACGSKNVLVGNTVRDKKRNYTPLGNFGQCDECNHIWVYDCTHCSPPKEKMTDV